MVDIPSSANQSSGGGGSMNALPLPDPLALLEGLVVGGGKLSPLPPSPQGEEGGGGGGGRKRGGTHIH